MPDIQFDTIGWFSVVQFSPKVTESKVSNVGVILLVPSLNYLNGVEDKTNSKTKEVFGNDINWENFNSEKDKFLTRIVKDKTYFRTSEDLERFSEVIGIFTITSPKRCIIDKAPFLILNDLFDTLIKEQSTKLGDTG